MKSTKISPEKLITGITIFVLAILLTTVTIYIAVAARVTNMMGWPFIFFLGLFAVGLPFFLTFGVFSVYRHTYLQKFPRRTDQVAWNKYIIQMLTLTTVIVVIVATLIWRDSEASRYFAENPSSNQTIVPSLVLGRGSIPLYFSIGRESKAVFFPTAMFWWACLGAITNVTQMILRRFSIGHLVAKSYLSSSLRLILSMIATALIFVAFHAWPTIFNRTNENLIENWPVLSLLAFFIGIFPNTIIQWTTMRVRKLLKLRGSDSLPLLEIQGIDSPLLHILNDEGVWSVVDLATRDHEALAVDIHMDTETLENWKEQAKLFAELHDKKIVDHFRKLGINDWSDLLILENIETEAITLDDLVNPSPDSGQVSPILIHVLKQKINGISIKR